MNANPMLCRMLGYSCGELMIRTFMDIIHPEERLDDLKQFLEGTTESIDTQRRLLHKNGHVVHVSLNLLRIVDEIPAMPTCIMLQFNDITEKKELERELLKAEELYLLIAENTQDIIYQCSEEGIIAYCSPSVKDILGYTSDELIGSTEELLFHQGDIPGLAASKEHGNPCQFRIRHKNGEYLWFETRVKKLNGESGSIVVVVIGREITERKKQQDIIAEAERIAIIGSWEWDICSNKVSFSDQLRRIYNFEEDELQNRPLQLTDLVPVEDQQWFHREIEMAMKDGHHDLAAEFRMINKDGTDKYLHIRGVVSYSETGVPLRINGTVQDVTERKLVEFKLQETIERYTSLKKYNHDAVMSLDLEGNIINANIVAQEMTGYAIQEMVGLNISRLIEKKGIKEILSHSLMDASVEKNIDRIHHKEGYAVEVLATIAPIIINRRNVGYYIIAKDITEQKKLIIDKETAESTNKAKTEFLAMMSHEIRTPMNGVIGMTDLLMETPTLDEEQRGYLEVIRKSGDTLLKIINDILDFSKIDSGKAELIESPFDVRATILESVSVLSYKAQEKQLHISFSVSSDIPVMLVGDEKRVKQILMNLISNAIKFTKTGGISIAAWKEAQADKKIKLKFMVKDTGTGIPKDQADQLFEPFKQLDNLMTREAEGTGLGLAICKKLVNLMGGEIWLEATEEPGAKFFFTVELREKEWKEAKSLEPTQLHEPSLQQPLRILVAEDNKINQMVLSKILAKQGHKVQIAERGSEVVEMALTASFDLIFMDVHMPEINGFEATTIIKDALKPADCPIIIAVTANALKGDREKCLASGMDEYISKPIRSRDVLEMIRKFFASEC
ncbi:hypothetical protein GCM10010916_23720 [Paenibacillus abyssi]|uniref:Circadian input-output histidine kinase CikA n=2 Tax=Paenibacillus abyssi TaxID=1340531 RepID=A0A917D1E3_9BACL|nr:hypothetical protein GCM10010916_23720 [Paenibacillus abyssi]